MARTKKKTAAPKRKASSPVPRRRTGRATQRAPATTAAARRATVRMYRLGVGDCFLLSFPRAGEADLRILIDCGVHQSQSGGSDRIRETVRDLKAVTGGRIDVVVGTHEHQDHLSGFPEIQKVLGEGCAGEIWAAWTEDEHDSLARSLKGKKEKALAALYSAFTRMRLAGADDQQERLGSLLGFFGDDSGPRLKTFGTALRTLSKKVRYLDPGAAPIELVDDQVRVFVLGPPRNKELLEKSDPSKREKGQVYFGAYAGLLEQVEPALGSEPVGPFDDRFSLPLDGTRALPFFKRHYWADTADGPDEERTDNTQEWRRIDAEWMSSATTLAMQLDEDTNNTSLVLAFELGPRAEGGPVMLFAADAQVGNWLSWQDVKFKVGDRSVTGPDLLKRTVLYKVGHHASHNATLNKLGLELMTSLELALVPTDSEMAKKVKWGTLPWQPLLDRLLEKTNSQVVRTDKAFGSKKVSLGKVTEDPLFYEVEI
ncbi:MBL fold metallo-hydrolase [Reyranella sp.]|uniref:MBL fold metallo-hydrolase n=1 Tax=Reyranella sp. TaxID=1929291 RepID=UPI003BACE04D